MVMGPTGSGKGTLIDHACSLYPEIVVPVSATTRSPRPGDVHGKHYHFLSEEEFKADIEKGLFLEWAIYGGNYYGTPKSEIMPRLDAGKLILLEIEVQGVRQLRDLLPKEQRVIVYIDGGSWDEIVERVRARAPITDAELEKRKARYDDEITFKSEADVMIENHDGGLEAAKKQFIDLVESVLHES